MIEAIVVDWMSTEVRAVLATASVGEAIRTLNEARVGGLPVVDESGRIVGVFSLTDAGRILSDGARRDADDSFYEPAALLQVISEKGAFDPGDLPVSGVMSRHVISVSPDATIVEAASKMAEHGVHRVVVRAADGTLRGILSALDVCRALAKGAS